MKKKKTTKFNLNIVLLLEYLPKAVVIIVSIAISLGIVTAIVLAILAIVFLKRKGEAKADPQSDPAAYYGKPPRSADSLLAALKDEGDGKNNCSAEKLDTLEPEAQIYSMSKAISTDYLNEPTALGTPKGTPLSPAPPNSVYHMSTTSFYQTLPPIPVGRPDSLVRPFSEIQRDSMVSSLATREMTEVSDERRSSYNPFRSSSITGPTGGSPPAALATSTMANTSSSSTLNNSSAMASSETIQYGFANASLPPPPRAAQTAAEPMPKLDTMYRSAVNINFDSAPSPVLSPTFATGPLPPLEKPAESLGSPGPKHDFLSMAIPTSRLNVTPSHAAEGRASSKRMVEEYLSSRKTQDRKSRYNNEFLSMMEQAIANNEESSSEATKEKPLLYYAKFDFAAREPGEMGFEKSDAIIVTDTSDDIWWTGYKTDSKCECV